MKTVAQTVIEADRFYTIAARTGSVVEAAASTKNEETVRLGKYDHKPEQEWAFIRVGDGVYRIRNRASGKLIDLMMTGTANGTWLHLWEDVGGTSQMWTVEPTPAGTVRLRSSWASGKCIDTVGMGVTDGAQLQIWQETAGEDQLWTISEVKDRASAKRATKKDEPAAAPVEEKAEVKEKAQEVLDKINAGEISFEDAVSKYSEDTGSKDNKGDVGWEKLTSFVDEYQSALSGLNKGDVSQLVESSYGYHIIKCTGYFHVDESVTSIDQVPKKIVSYIKNILKTQKESTAYSEWMCEYIEKADIQINDMPKEVPYYVSLKGVTPSTGSSSTSSE